MANRLTSELLGVSPSSPLKYTDWSDTQVKRHIHQLVDKEYTASNVGSKGREYVYELQYVDPVDSGGKFLSCLIDADELARLIE